MKKQSLAQRIEEKIGQNGAGTLRDIIRAVVLAEAKAEGLRVPPYTLSKPSEIRRSLKK